MVTIVLSYYQLSVSSSTRLDKKSSVECWSPKELGWRSRPTSMRPFGVFWLTTHVSTCEQRVTCGYSRSAAVPFSILAHGPRLIIEVTLGWRNGPLLSTHTDDGDGEYWVYIIYWTTNDSKCTFRQKASRAMEICHKHYYMPADPCTAHRCYKLPDMREFRLLPHHSDAYLLTPECFR